jgi:hypothetical protein
MSDAPLRLEGLLDEVRASDSTFALRADDGRLIRGRLVGPSVEAVAPFLGRRVMVLGTGQADQSGATVWIDAAAMLLAPGPLPKAPALPGSTAEGREEMAKRLKAALGTWPGDETDEEVERALRQVR